MTTRILSATLFAAGKHRNQRRKDKEATPYINHPIHVASLLADSGVVDVDVLIAGLLHDTIEDTNTSGDEIKELFGVNVCNIVLECSDDKSLTKIKRKQLQLEHASDVSLGAKLVKLADKYSNLNDLLHNPPKSWSKDEIFGYSVWVYAIYMKLRGINKWLDDKFAELFAKFGLDAIKGDEIDKLLEGYYANIKNSE
ncbi:MAG: HD superfamily phosphohydrolase [Hyperionvirus sp.]|uniref:HD superfamily phosphohydrolase n=1 Tax=Hyperionvirus sp. TaxID=2487770 RepID=A0A3G5A5N4_9VIRU|nr:MAG: HD superfamily phosphohydrolase [Hyperionvirus sp.]